MAKQAKPADAKRSNTHDGEALQKYIQRIEAFHADIASENEAAARRKAKISQSIAVVYTEAKALGIPKSILKTHVELRKLDAKKSAIVNSLSEDETETYEATVAALGDFASLPLGAAAVEKSAKTQDPRDAAALAALN